MSGEWSDEARRKRLELRAMLAGKDLVVMPGGFSPVYARMAQEIGFRCFFLAGSQLSGFLLGVPDAGILGLRDIVDHARHVAAHTSIPLLLDADTGFGNAVNVHYSVQEIVRCGVAALNIEDQEAPKKSPTGGGRRCIPLDEATGKSRGSGARRDRSFVICARAIQSASSPILTTPLRAVLPTQKQGPISSGSTPSRGASSSRAFVRGWRRRCCATGSARSSRRQVSMSYQSSAFASRSTRSWQHRPACRVHGS